MDANISSGTISLLPLDPFNVNNKLLPVYLDDFPNLLALVMAPNNLKKKTKLSQSERIPSN